MIVFFSNTQWKQLLKPLCIFMSKMSLKYVSIQGMIMNMKLSSHDFLFFHRNINRSGKQSPNSLNHPSQ